MYGQRPEGDAAEPRRHWTTAPDGTVAFTSHAEVAAVNAVLRRLDPVPENVPALSVKPVA